MVLHKETFELLVCRGNSSESLYELPFVCQTQTCKSRILELQCLQICRGHIMSVLWHLELEKLQPGCSVSGVALPVRAPPPPLQTCSFASTVVKFFQILPHSNDDLTPPSPPPPAPPPPPLRLLPSVEYQ